MDKAHEENLALIRGGQGVTIGSRYFTKVGDYCEAYELPVPERDREPEAEGVQEEKETSPLALPARVFLEAGEGEQAGLVRKVYLEDWREEADGDQELEGVVTFAPEGFDEHVATRAQELAAGPLLPSDARERLIAIKGIEEAKADEILKALE